MKLGRSLQELAIELTRQNEQKQDYVVNTARISMWDDGNDLIMNSVGGSKQITLSMSDLFHRQIGKTLQIPAKYYDKMRLDSPTLLAENVNHWFEKNETTHMVRTLDNKARAFLSDRYRRIDNYDVAMATLPILSQIEDARVESCEVTDNKMYIKVVNPRLQAEITPGDIVQSGIIITNSEVGLGSVTVMPLLYRLVCSNGMVINDLGKRKYHLGRTMEESWELYSDETLQAEDGAFMLKLGDIVKSAVDETRFNKVVDRLRETTEIKIKGNIPDVIQLTAKEYGLTNNESDNILKHLITGADLSLYGLANAVTRSAHDVTSYDRSTEMETIGWEIATMPRATWATINM